MTVSATNWWVRFKTDWGEVDEKLNQFKLVVVDEIQFNVLNYINFKFII